MNRFDVIIIGAGAGGGVLAGLLSEGGKRVLLLEKGRNAPDYADIGRDHLRNQRLSQYGVNAGPDDLAGDPRVFEDFRSGKTHTALAHQGGYSHNAFIVGGGTRVYGAQAWRFHPLDFRMATTYGVPDGSSLADWPLDYAELAPFYARAERELGVAGDADAMAHLPRYESPYPMPPVTPDTVPGRTLRAGAASLGWRTNPVPLAINSVPYNGRPACIHCPECVGFACPVDAKNGSQNTLISRAALTGRCTLIAGATVSRLERNDSGRITGVSYFAADGIPVTVEADMVVVAGGAVETARLLLLSGIGGDNVGRHLQGHYYPCVYGRFETDINDGVGPGPSTATCKFSHGNDGVIGGAMIADDFVVLPATFWKRNTPPGLPRWGATAKEWMQVNYQRVLQVCGPVQEIPSPDCRVTLDPDIRDKFGIPAVRLSGATHSETVRTSAFMFDRAREWLLASGAVETWGTPPGQSLSGGQHQAGTCRMGDDPRTSVTDRNCRVHGHPNLYIGDGSVHVTNGGFNPFLTIMALAYRTADHILREG
ncbi:MAG: GMC family oxidoreductase [Fibrella sp.]|nr:GMC family oxidoreductase [Armatimonadota bacterium]